MTSSTRILLKLLTCDSLNGVSVNVGCLTKNTTSVHVFNECTSCLRLDSRNLCLCFCALLQFSHLLPLY